VCGSRVIAVFWHANHGDLRDVQIIRGHTAASMANVVGGRKVELAFKGHIIKTSVRIREAVQKAWQSLGSHMPYLQQSPRFSYRSTRFPGKTVPWTSIAIKPLHRCVIGANPTISLSLSPIHHCPFQVPWPPGNSTISTRTHFSNPPRTYTHTHRTFLEVHDCFLLAPSIQFKDDLLSISTVWDPWSSGAQLDL
jgi:hypothetical protein